MITTVISDLGNVLLHYNSEQAYGQLGMLAGRSPAEVRQIIYTPELEHAFNKGLMTQGEYFRKCSQALGLNCGYAKFVDTWVDNFSPNDNVISGLKKLKGKYRLALLSNINILHFEHVREKFPAEIGLFNQLILSYKVHMRKPEPGIFMLALHNLGEKPEACLFIDDKLGNVEVARSLGMRAEVYSKDSDFEAILKQNGVLV